MFSREHQLAPPTRPARPGLTVQRDLRQRLLQYARQKLPNVLFGWMLAEDANEAYRLECYLWHAHGGAWAGIAGDAHPSPSEPIPFLGCPDCDE